MSKLKCKCNVFCPGTMKAKLGQILFVPQHSSKYLFRSAGGKSQTGLKHLEGE